MRSRWFTFLAMLAPPPPTFSHALSGRCRLWQFRQRGQSDIVIPRGGRPIDILTRITEVEEHKLYFRTGASPQRERDAREIIRVAKQTGYVERLGILLSRFSLSQSLTSRRQPVRQAQLLRQPAAQVQPLEC